MIGLLALLAGDVFTSRALARLPLPLEDQQLGGLIMWIPGGLAYLAAGLVLCARWLRAAPAA